MASIGKDRNGRRRVLFVDSDGSRKTIRLGKVTAKQAAAFKVKLEALIAGRLSTGSIDDETARWIAELPDDTHGKLAAVGLVQPRASLRLGEFLKQYIEGRADIKPGTVLVLKQAPREPDRLLRAGQALARDYRGRRRTVAAVSRAAGFERRDHP